MELESNQVGMLILEMESEELKNMSSNNHSQEVSDHGTAIQAGGNVNITTTGISYADVRDVALDVFKSNFYELAGQAKQIAQTRAEEITEEFLKKLQTEHRDGFEKSQDPDFQYALFTVQKEYARTGDKELGDLLVDILVDRSKQDQRNILQIVLNESLSVAPKITDSQLAILAIIFVLEYTQNYGVGSHEKFGEFLDTHVAPFVQKLAKNEASYQHLEFTGCGSHTLMRQSLEEILGNSYKGLFLKGFDESELKARQIDQNLISLNFVPCLNDNTKIQVNAISNDFLEKKLNSQEVTGEVRGKIISMFDFGKMNNSEIKNKCIEIRPYMTTIFDVWSNSPMGSFSLTSVGMAIGHANIKRLIGEFANLSIWIN